MIPILHREPSSQRVSVVNSPDSGFILWELDHAGIWRERQRALGLGSGGTIPRFESWAAVAMLRTFAGCSVERAEECTG